MSLLNNDETTSEVQQPEEQLDRIWEELVNHNCPHEEHSQNKDRHWPSYDCVMDDMTSADYNHTLTCPHDLRFLTSHNNNQKQHHKTLCPHGAVCRAKLELFSFPQNHPYHKYTGLLTPGTTHQHCLIRLSSAIKPPHLEIQSKLARALLYAAGDKVRNAKLFPTAALKVFRDNNVRSGNLLFGGCKVGQKEPDYFAHCQCTQMTERMPRTLKPFVRKFWQYSDTPLSLGVSDFCAHNQEGNAVSKEDIQFPFALILRPRYVDVDPGVMADDTTGSSQNEEDDGKDSFDYFLDGVLAIPEGTVLFDVFACPTPALAMDPSKLQRIGRIISTSRMIPSNPDDRLFFRHQRKEEDLQLRPEWKEQLKTKCAIQDGRRTSKGTVATLAGCELFEAHIEQGDYYDFELPSV